MLSKRIQLTILSITLVIFVTLGFVYISTLLNNSSDPELDGVKTSLQITNEPVVIYLDSNNNQAKDTKESFCKQCIGKQILVEINTEEGEEIVLREVGKEGQLDIVNLNVIRLWSYLPKQNIVIPVYSFAAELAGTDINIPANEFGHALIGENANIENIDTEEISEEFYSTNITIPVLIPALENALLIEKPLFIVYYPNGENNSNYFVSNALVTQDAGNTNLKSIWHLKDRKTTLEESTNYVLLLPKS